ncbi:MAG TPA: hypothetical protein VGL56_04015 [Fimbriimonadaceae bacterium]|jgi:hypothetical protein
MPKTWNEKYNNGKEPFVGPSIRKISGFPPGTQMLVPVPSQVDQYIRSIPSGEERTTAQMSKDLAQSAGAELTCPMCCGMFLRICSEKAFEDYAGGAPIESITPFWRMVNSKNPIRNKLSFGVELVDAMRRKEGIELAATH